VFGEVRYGGYTNEYHNIISDCTVCGFQDTVEKPHNPDRSGKCACGYKECKHVGDSVITYHRISAEEEKYSKCHIRYRVCNVEGCGVIKETRVESHTWDGNTCTGCKIEKRNITENEQICEKEGHRLKTYYANVINSDGYEFGNTMHGVYEKCEVCLEVVSHLGSAPHSAWGEEKEDTIGTYRECVDCGYKNYTKK